MFDAEIAAILVTADGTVVSSDFAARCISISADQMLHTPRVIGVAGGADKAEAVVAVARAGLLTGLVTERALAEAALATPPGDPKPICEPESKQPDVIGAC